MLVDWRSKTTFCGLMGNINWFWWNSCDLHWQGLHGSAIGVAWVGSQVGFHEAAQKMMAELSGEHKAGCRKTLENNWVLTGFDKWSPAFVVADILMAVFQVFQHSFIIRYLSRRFWNFAIGHHRSTYFRTKWALLSFAKVGWNTINSAMKDRLQRFCRMRMGIVSQILLLKSILGMIGISFWMRFEDRKWLWFRPFQWHAPFLPTVVHVGSRCRHTHTQWAHGTRTGEAPRTKWSWHKLLPPLSFRILAPWMASGGLVRIINLARVELGWVPGSPAWNTCGKATATARILHVYDWHAYCVGRLQETLTIWTSIESSKL